MTKSEPLPDDGSIGYRIEMPDGSIVCITLSDYRAVSNDYRVWVYRDGALVNEWRRETEWLARQTAIAQARVYHKMVNAALDMPKPATLRQESSEHNRETGKTSRVSPWSLTDAEREALRYARDHADYVGRGRGDGLVPRPVLASLVRKGLAVPFYRTGVNRNAAPWKGWAGVLLTALGRTIAGTIEARRV